MKYILTYLSVDIMSLIVLLYLIKALHSDRTIIKEKQLFQYVIISAIALIALDSIWILGENHIFPYHIITNKIVNSLYMADTALISYLWFLFSETKLKNKFIDKLSNRIIVGLPFLILLIMCGASIKTGWIFTVTPQNMYTRGPLYPVQVVISYAYLILTALHALIDAFMATTSAKRRESFTLASFVALPLIGSLVQTLVVGVSTSIPMICLSILFVFMNMQESHINHDALTTLNNRRSSDNYLYDTIHEHNDKQKLTVFMIDINNFKKINDTYGHAEGDRALKAVAKAIKALSDADKTFCARYGGDEFIVISDGKTKVQPEEFIENLHTLLDNINKSNEYIYSLSVSIGYSQFKPLIDDAKSLVSRADIMLYKNKSNFHNH